jgi:anti-sigma B factor antagonist
MPDDPVRLSVTRNGPRSFELIGELDAHSSLPLDELLAPESATQHITLDMAKVEFMDSSGLRMLLELRTRATEAGTQLVLRAPSRQVARVLQVSGLDDVFQVVPTQ